MLPSGDFFVNAVYLRLMALAYNLFAALKATVLPLSYRPLRLKTLSHRLLGIPALDLGLPLWGMHSIRETTGREDPVFLRNTFTTYWNE